MMNNLHGHIKWLVDTSQRLQTADGKPVEVWELRHQHDEEVLSAWAKHFRNHYCLDNQIDHLRHGTPHSRAEYLIHIKFPDSQDPPGPSIRSGDFGEILVADYLEFLMGYWVPRTRYCNKDIRNESTKGCDIIGFRFFDPKNESPRDILAIFESKAQFSGGNADNRLQNAVDDSGKDQRRKAESLNAMKQRFLDSEDSDSAIRVERFQNVEDKPYRELSGAAALYSRTLFDPTVIQATSTINHPNRNNLRLIVICGQNMMDLVHELYRRAADEA